MNITETVYFPQRSQWRQFLAENHDKLSEIWLIYPQKDSGEPAILYNDAVEEALCFGWIDSTIKHLDPLHRAQRFTPRRNGSSYSRANIERLIWLDGKKMLMPQVRAQVRELIETPYVFPEDILQRLQNDEEVWKNYQAFSEPYKRIRIAYIEEARGRPEQFEKRLNNFIAKTRKNQLIRGYGGIEKYYH
jgi:uncharacterized protein YdeI (YjbR/CyaY-like superfamily)